MNTMQNFSHVLRGLAIAGLCAAGLAAAAPAQAPRTAIEGLSLQPTAATPAFIAPPPLLVAPTCPTCWLWRGLDAPGPSTEPSAPLRVAPRGCGSSCQDPSEPEYAWRDDTPLRLAGGPPTSVVDACHARRCAG